MNSHIPSLRVYCGLVWCTSVRKLLFIGFTGNILFPEKTLWSRFNSIWEFTQVNMKENVPSQLFGTLRPYFKFFRLGKCCWDPINVIYASRTSFQQLFFFGSSNQSLTSDFRGRVRAWNILIGHIRHALPTRKSVRACDRVITPETDAPYEWVLNYKDNIKSKLTL